MGINSGGRSDGGRRPRRIERGQPKKPFQPIHNPFEGERPAFEMGTYEVIEEKDDYLVCRGYDPLAKFPLSPVTPLAIRTVKVAKPPLLQKTPWDGETLTIDGVNYAYSYTGLGERTVTIDGVDQDQAVETPYFVGDTIVAVEVRRTHVQKQSGMEVNDVKIKDEDGAFLQWVDLNVSGRHWRDNACESIICRPKQDVDTDEAMVCDVQEGPILLETDTGECIIAVNGGSLIAKDTRCEAIHFSARKGGEKHLLTSGEVSSLLSSFSGCVSSTSGDQYAEYELFSLEC